MEGGGTDRGCGSGGGLDAEQLLPLQGRPGGGLRCAERDPTYPPPGRRGRDRSGLGRRPGLDGLDGLFDFRNVRRHWPLRTCYPPCYTLRYYGRRWASLRTSVLLESIEVQRFKSIIHQTVSFGRVNLFVGGNGSGKSNLLEAIGVLSAALARGVTDADLVARGVRLSTPAFFKSAFKNRKLPSTLRVEAKFSDELTYNFELMASPGASYLRFKNESSTYHSSRMFGRSGNGATLFANSLSAELNPVRGMYDQLRPIAQFPSGVLSAFDNFSKYAIYSPQTEFLRGTEVGAAQQPPIGLHGEGLPQATEGTLELWRRATGAEKERIRDIFKLVWATGWTDQFGTGITNPALVSSQIKTGLETIYFRDRFLHKARNRITAYDASEGVLFLLFMVVLLAHPDSPRIFALDNVDSALNPRMTKFAVSKIIEVVLAKNEDRQVFMTSHNPTAMDAIDLFDDRTRIFTLSRNDEGHTIVKRITAPKNMSREEWIEKKGGRSLSELWISDEIPGALGDRIL